MRLLRAAARLVAAIGVCAGLQLYGAHAATGPVQQLAEPFDASAIDPHGNACEDFFGYATGAYRKGHPIPPAFTEYGYIEQLVDATREIVRDILVHAQRDPGAAGSNAEKLGIFYTSCMDTAAIERRGLAPLAPELARIDALQRSSELSAEFEHLHAIGVDAGFAFNATQDYHNSAHTIGELDQAGLGLPERDYYLRGDADSRKLRAQYLAYVSRLLSLSGSSDALTAARSVVALETRFARASTPAADLREPEATYHPMTLTAIAALAPHVALRSYLRAQAVTTGDTVNVAEPAFLEAVDAALTDVPLPIWKRYMRWRLLDTFAPALPARFDNEHFAFREHILNGAAAQLPRWKRCVSATDLYLGEAVGEAYVAKVFPRAAKVRALTLSVRIKDAYRNEMEGLSWMTPATKRIAEAKLTAMGLKVGYPQRWRSFATYAVTPDSYAANIARGATFERNYELARIGRPVDRTAWSMTPQTVNAYNDTQRNEIVLPAAQLQRPFFDFASDDAANLGATGGGTIGHEMTHGFDDEGHKFDAAGNLRNWWTSRDLMQFNARAHCVIDQFNNTVAVGNVHYQGRLVAGEAIADLGGVIIGDHALRTTLAKHPGQRIAGFTPEQRYFLAFAQSWAENIRPEAARRQALTDPHPLPRDRVNATLANIPAWYAAFGCVKPPRPICEIW